MNVYVLFNENTPVEAFVYKHDAYEEQKRLELEGEFNKLSVKSFLLNGYESLQCYHSHLDWDFFPRRDSF